MKQAMPFAFGYARLSNFHMFNTRLRNVSRFEISDGGHTEHGRWALFHQTTIRSVPQ